MSVWLPSAVGTMFSFKRKDKDQSSSATGGGDAKAAKLREKEKEKKDPKKRKDRTSLTSDDLKRLEDARRSLLGRSKKKDKDKLPSGITADYVSNFYQSDATAEFSYVAGASVPRSPPPAVPPKPPKRGILKGGSVDSAAGSERDSFFDDSHLMQNTIQNELIGYNYENLPPKPEPRSPPVYVSSPLQSPVGSESSPEIDRKSSKELNLDCPLPVVLPAKAPRARTVEIKRLESGDFGFSLRRANVVERTSDPQGSPGKSSSTRVRTVIFAEPGLTGRANETGLLPGDKLLEVNGVNVEKLPREDIITMIRASGDLVTLKVQPVPELLELSRRSWGGTDEDSTKGDLEDAYIRGGTLRRSGSKRRLVSAQAKSDGELATEKAWLEADKVWVVHKRGFSGGAILRGASEENGGNSGSLDKVRVKLDFNAETIAVGEEDIEKANPPHLDHIEDLSQLRFINESSILHVIRQRYGSNLVHTYAGGNSLVVVNPMTPLTVYSEKVAQLFKGCRAEDMPPHIYAVGQKAHAAMLATRRDQSVVLLGRSGSGKTTNSQHLLNYLLLTAGSHSKSITVDKLHAVFKLLDAFGNSRTVMNTNASRYSNVFSLDFDPSGNVVSASVQVLMLEKSRVVRRPEGEPNFHIFYQLLAGVDAATRKQLHLEDVVAVDGSTPPCLFMTPLQRAEDKQRAFVAWGHIMAAMHALSIQPKEVRVLCAVLAAIYHLGVAGATQGHGGKFQFIRPQSGAWAASLLGMTTDELLRILRGGSPSSSSLNAGSSPATSSQAPLPPLEALEGFATGLYSEVFSALIALVNRSISASNSQAANSIVIVDSPGVQNPFLCGRQSSATFEDLCHNYLQERLQLLFHDMTFTLPQDRYAQEKVEFPVVEDMSGEDGGVGSPGPMVSLLDYANQLHHSLSRSGTSQADGKGDRRGLLWLLDDEAIFPGSSDLTLVERIASVYSDRQWRPLISNGPDKNSLTLSHLQGTCPVVYNAIGWLKACRENPMVRAAACCLTETSTREEIRELFTACRPSGGGSGATGLVSGSIAGIEGGVGLRRASSIRRAFTTGTAAIRRKSVALQTKFQADGLVEQLRRTRVHFVHCFLPQTNAGLCDLKQMQLPENRGKDDIMMNVPLVRHQLRGAQILEAVRVHKQGFPESVPFREFVRKFAILIPAEARTEAGTGKPTHVDDKKLILDYLVPQLDLEPNVFRVGLSQIFFRAGVLSQLESVRDERIQGRIVMLQAYCRGCLARKKLAKRRVEDVAIRCIQRNVSKYLAVRSWPWWRLYTKVAPLLNVHRTEEELKLKSDEVETLRAKLEKAEKERSQLKSANDRLEARLSELTADLAEEHSTSTLAAEKLEAETAERMRLQQELSRLQGDFKGLEKSKDKLETELMYSRATSAAAQLNGQSGDEDGMEEASVYKVRYERAMRELEHVKQRLMTKHEEDVEQLINVKKSLEKRLHDAQEEAEEQRQVVSQWKRKVTRLQGELADLKHLHEEQTGRNNILEKRQRKFDAELQSSHDEVKAERREKERVQRERDLALGDKYSLEQQLQSLKLDLEMKEDRIQNLMRELDDISSSSVGDNELTALKRLKHDLEMRLKDQNDELDELSGQAQLWEAAKTRLEMSLEQMRKEHKKEVHQLTEEMEEIRANAQKKVRALEAQLETEHDERTQLLREKHELERKLTEIHSNGLASKADHSKVQALKRELKKARALLQDAQTALDRAQKDNNPSRIIIRQLKNQLEDLEFAKMAAIKARQVAEAEARDLQSQVEELSRSKSEIETRLVNLQREKNSILSQLEDHEDELKEVMRKFKAAVQQSSTDQSIMVEQANQIAQLEQERNNLREHLNELTARLESMAGEELHALEAKKLAAKIRQLETRFELEQSTKTRLEATITKLKEQVEALTQDLENARVREQAAQEAQKRAVRQFRDVQDDYATLQLRETEAISKKDGLEQQLEQYETENLTLKSDLTLALKRIEDLQVAMQEAQDDSDDSDLGSNRLGSSGDEDEEDESESEFTSAGTYLSARRGDHFSKRSRNSSLLSSMTNEDEADRSLRIEEERFALPPSYDTKSAGVSLLNSPTNSNPGGTGNESEV